MEVLAVKNYRSIMNSGQVELLPITVLLGRNSAGKSSFIRLIPLLKQTIEKKISDSLLWFGDYVDFGEYNNVVNKYNVNTNNECMEIGFSINVKRHYNDFRHRRYWGEKTFLVNVNLKVREKYFEEIEITVFDQRIVINVDSSGRALIKINGDDNVFEKKKIYAFRFGKDLLPSLFEEVGFTNNVRLYGLNTSNLEEKCRTYFYDGINHEKMNPFIFYSNTDIELGSKIDILNRLKTINNAKFANRNLEHKMIQRYNNYIVAIELKNLIDSINQALNDELLNTSYIKPIRATVDRYYRVQGVSIEELDSDGSSLPMILKNMSSSELREYAQWSKKSLE